ncbi:putative amine oxidase [copper-containing] [Haliotis cracherodii]|uniref:putative amine oxidase [copper-containing] n=1 Tax=Haliotis cracherodii TaxID=6455 RepID=UPI0039EC55AD
MAVRKSNGWRLMAGVLILVCVGLIVIIVAFVVKVDLLHERGEHIKCGSRRTNNIDPSEAALPGLHDDLTFKELKAIQEYIYTINDLNIVKPSQATVNSSYIYTSDLHPPKKSDVLAYMAGTGPKPERHALLMIFRGDAVPPVVEEYIVGPLPEPTRHSLYVNSARKNPVPFAFRPVGFVEFRSLFVSLYPEIDRKIGFILTESYGATFTNCGSECLSFYPDPVSSGLVKQTVRKLWLITLHELPYRSLHCLDLLILANLNSSDPTEYFVERLVYSGKDYSSLDDLAKQYNISSTPKTQVPFPKLDKDMFSTLNRRGTPVPTEPLRAPRMFEPDGKRYKVKHRSVEYMQWQFDFRMSSMQGPQLHNIRFNNETIAYEIGLQEIGVFYSSKNKATTSANLLDSMALIGSTSHDLVPAVDCPETSTFFNATYIGESMTDDPIILKNAFCLFEHNKHTPLRRHMAYSLYGVYSGMPDSVLTLRSILTVGNYDYVLDFIFHQSGALEVSVLSTGYILSTFHTPSEKPYGFKLQDHITGPLHHHVVLFKADIDIHGTDNRYETLDISTEEVPNHLSSDPSDTYFQIRFDRKLKRTELEAAYKCNFDHPKYHIIHSNEYQTRHNELKAYRLQLDGMSKQLLPVNTGNEPAVSWARHQMAVTKFKEEERYASSCYAVFDSFDNTVNFTTFLADDEDVVDEDLVFWIPMGAHHIPHTEDLPVVATSGTQMSFALYPYNYFPECPSSQSRDSIRVELKDKNSPEGGFTVERYGNAPNITCLAHAPNIEQHVPH